jgi:hypothetical protein
LSFLEESFSVSQFITEIADRTGESYRTIKQLGFQIVEFDSFDDADPLLLIDCPCCGKAIFLAANVDELPELAECETCDALFDYRDHEVYPLDGATPLSEAHEHHVP